MGRTVMKFEQRLAILERLRQCCETREVDGERYAVFRDGMNDRRVAEGMLFTCSSHHVIGVRESMFGRLPSSDVARRDAEALTLSGALTRIAELEISVASLVQENRRLELRLEAMEAGVNNTLQRLTRAEEWIKSMDAGYGDAK